jgi:hypothetical protein
MIDAAWWHLPALLVLGWLALHALAWRLLRLVLSQMGDVELSRSVAERHACLTVEQQRYLRRIVRTQVYYIGAALTGAYLMLQYDSPSALVRQYTDVHEVVFSAALAHWLTAFWEDGRTFSSFYLFEHNGRKLGGGTLLMAYLVHHAAAATLYGFCLRTQLLSSVGAIGLLFEGPVVFVNLREIAVVLDSGWHDGQGGAGRRPPSEALRAYLSWLWGAAA